MCRRNNNNLGVASDFTFVATSIDVTIDGDRRSRRACGAVSDNNPWIGFDSSAVATTKDIALIFCCRGTIDVVDREVAIGATNGAFEDPYIGRGEGFIVRLQSPIPREK